MTERAQQLLNQLTNQYQYSDSTLLLFRQLTTFFTSIVQDDICLRKKSHENRLHDILCDFSMAYVPVPIEEQWIQHGKLVNGKSVLGEGSNGRIYRSGTFGGNPIVTKTKKKWSNHTVFDIYINFVILNSLLLKGKLTDHLIPSYGMFLCTVNEDGTEICMRPSKQEHLFLVQKEVKGKTLSRHIKHMTLDRFQHITHEIFDVLLTLEASPYQMYHTDLHCGNIMMCANEEGLEHAVLLDFELCSFSVTDESGKSHRYRLNSLENQYCQREQVLSGAHDAILYFAHVSAFENAPLHAYCMNHLRFLCRHFWVDVDCPMEVDSTSFYDSERRWIFQRLYDAEQLLPMARRTQVHSYNMSQLRKMTYRWIVDTLNL